MIAVDTSALMAIVLGERLSDSCIAALEAEDSILISAGTVAEALVVAVRKNVRQEVAGLIEGLDMQVVPVTLSAAQRVGEAYTRWSKGRHGAKLNFGDCFAYEVAKQNACPLLYIGKDFSRTDIESVL